MARSQARFVILDRDGVINRDSDEYIKDPSEWIPLPGALEAIARLSASGWTVAIATNQSGVGRGLFSEETLRAIHARMLSAISAAGGRIAGIYYCPHRPGEGCDCRKPRPGLLEQAAADLGMKLAGTPYIGDKRTDVQAAVAAGAKPVLVGPDSGRIDVGEISVERHRDLAAAVDALLGTKTS